MLLDWLKMLSGVLLALNLATQLSSTGGGKSAPLPHYSRAVFTKEEPGLPMMESGRVVKQSQV